MVQAAQTMGQSIMTKPHQPLPLVVKEPPPSIGLVPTARRTATVDGAAVASAAVAATTVEQAAAVPTAVAAVTVVAGSSDGRGCGEHPQPVVTAVVAVVDALDAMD
jgi:hypothetical protein